MKTMRKNNGFTLVELSIVLVIVGLLIGGLLVGQSLMDSAKLNSQVKQLEQYDIATTNFRQKYKQWPGDSTYFPHSTGYTTGNGDGFINDHGGNNPPQSLLDEPARFFNHLYLSGNLKEDHSSAYSPIGKGSMPELKIAKGRGMTVTMTGKGELYYFLGIYEIIGGSMAYYQMSPSGIMTASTAMAIDAKLDDGIPNKGNILATQQYPQGPTSAIPHALDTAANGCTTSGTAYNLANSSDTACRLTVKSNVSK